MGKYQYTCACGYKLILRDDHAGKVGKCPKCGSRVQITRELLDSLSGGTGGLLGRVMRSIVGKAAEVGEPLIEADDIGQIQPMVAGQQMRNDVQASVVAEAAVAGEWKVGDEILGLYEVLPVNDDGEAFHAGGFGKVYKVRHKAWNMDLAVKSPHAHAFQMDAQKKAFTEECQAWIDLGMHPNIATCYYVRELGGVPHVFAEYVDGGSLSEWIDSGRLYDGDNEETILRRMLDIAIQFAWGLHYAHEQKMIHQDVKPQNVMLSQDGRVKVVDFGLVRMRSTVGVLRQTSDPQQSIMAAHAGGYTPAYCSPEQVSGNKLTRRTDVWSWGLSVLAMFTGGASWASGVLAAHVLEALPELRDEDEDIPAMPTVLRTLLQDCFRVEESARPHTMMDVADRLIGIYKQLFTGDYPRAWSKGASNTPDVLNNRALSYIDLNLSDRAVEAWEAALRADPHHLDTTYNYGLHRWRTGLIDDLTLVEHLEAVRTTHEDSWQDEYLIGLVHIERRDAGAAIEMLQEAAEQSGEDGDVVHALTLAKEHRESGWRRCVRTFGDQALSVAISPDGRYGLSGGLASTLMLWELASGQCVRTFIGHSGWITSATISPDGRHVLSGSRDNTLKLWDLASGQCIGTFEGHSNWVNSVAISPDGRYGLSGSGDKRLKLWDLASGECVRTFEGHDGPICSVAISPDGHYGLSGSSDKTLKLWDLANGQCVRTFEGHSDSVSSVAISPDGRYGLSGSRDDTLKLWDLTSGECVRTLEGHRSAMSSVTISPDGRYGLSGSWDKTLKLWDLASGECVRTFEGHGNWVNSVTISPDGRYGLSASLDWTLKCWDLSKGQCVQTFNATHCNEVTSVAVSSDGHFGLSGSEDTTLKLWDLLGGRCVRTLTGHRNKVTSVAISPDGRYGLSGSEDATLKLWDLPGGRCARTLEGHDGPVCSVAISPDGRYGLSGSQDKRLKLWEPASGQCVRTFEGHRDWVTSVAISPDGRYGLSGSRDDTLKLWDLASGQCVRTFQGHCHPVASVAITPTVATGSREAGTTP